MTLEQARIAGGDILFFILTEDDPYAMVDLDNVRDPVTGDIDPRALEIVREYDSYTEVSPSGTGLRIFVEGESMGNTTPTVHGLEIEAYSKGRLASVTGDHLAGTPLEVAYRQNLLTRDTAKGTVLANRGLDVNEAM
jgi:putative DNA primase/helicase